MLFSVAMHWKTGKELAFSDWQLLCAKKPSHFITVCFFLSSRGLTHFVCPIVRV